MEGPPLHPDLEPLRPLLGTWEGHGQGSYPIIEPFGYREQTTVGHGGKPFLVISQRTWAIDDGRPLHVETGYLRLPAPGRAELVIAHPTGHVEVAEGTVEATGDAVRLRLVSTTVAATGTAKRVDALERDLSLEGHQLIVALRMAAVGEALTGHLTAELRRTPAPDS